MYLDEPSVKPVAGLGDPEAKRKEYYRVTVEKVSLVEKDSETWRKRAVGEAPGREGNEEGDYDHFPARIVAQEAHCVLAYYSDTLPKFAVL